MSDVILTPTNNGESNVTPVTGTTVATKRGLDVNLIGSSDGSGFTTDSAVATLTDSDGYTFDCSPGYGTLAIRITGTWTSEIFFSASYDGANFDVIYGVNYDLLDGQLYTSTTANGVYKFNVSGVKSIKFSNVTTGSAPIQIAASRSASVLDGILAPTFVKQLGADTWTVSSAIQSVRIDEASSTVTYVGKAAVGSLNADAVWQIQRLTVSGSVTTIEYADGDSNFNNIWNNRASLSYS